MMLKLMLKFFKSIKQKKEQKRKRLIAEAHAEKEKIFLDFMANEGKLPEGFSEPYTIYDTRVHFVYRGTPFKEYLTEIRHSVDSLNDESGISNWLNLDESVEIDTAAQTISNWRKRHREMDALLHENCYLAKAKTHIWSPSSPYCDKKIMIVIDDGSRFNGITEESIQKCKDQEISFCTILSECKMYDLIEQKEKEITYRTYPNYHDETYADWSFQ